MKKLRYLPPGSAISSLFVLTFLARCLQPLRAWIPQSYSPKLGIAVEEIDEAVGWLEFMDKGSIATDKALLNEATELCAIFTASLQTSRANWEAEQAARRRKKRARTFTFHVPDPRS